ncbi:homoserine O-acetyltransferase [Flavihumibacter rivuli]|uniref:homoserine O-acetyltransferase MetX n=1 Tax=Flavihumibacter rivuli TaxID=2838156 RepID=UPI001BDE30A0|nr:homoserine O-acetyltransferase [Flavihumibacter rivuli]ULQ56640.1 homoserine O-acetyltransferase [Flavihumibacter rivuli]
MLQRFESDEPLMLENGGVLPRLEIAYHTYGQLNADASNVVWVCHALTANADAADWWNGFVGGNGAIDPGRHFIVCANILGSCYGSSGPLSVDPSSGSLYYSRFPMVTIRDMVNAHIRLRKHLGIDRIKLLMGGSMGGYQVLEWALMEPEVVETLFLIATSAAESAWGISIHEAQRLAIEADSTWRDSSPGAGSNGLKAARAIGMLTYRNYAIMCERQSDPDNSKVDGFKAASYIRYQGDKLVQRFNAQSYWILSRSMDSHNISRGRGATVEEVLSTIRQKTLVIGIASDLLCPPEEQRKMARGIPGANYVEIDSAFGHDGFLVEAAEISKILVAWMDGDPGDK